MPHRVSLYAKLTVPSIHQLVGAVTSSGHPGKKADMPVRLVNKNTNTIPYPDLGCGMVQGGNLIHAIGFH